MSTLDVLRATAPPAPDELRARVLASRPVTRPRRRMRPVLVLATAAALAVAAALVHGFSTSAPPVERQVHGSAPASGAAATTTQSYAAAPQRTKDALVTAPRNRLTHTDASIRVRVSNTDELGAATNR